MRKASKSEGAKSTALAKVNASEVVWKRFAKAIDRDKFIDMLEGSPDPRFQNLFHAVLSDHYDLAKYSIPSLCRKFDIPYDQIAQACINHNVLNAAIQASNALPAIVDDLVKDARSREETCWKCDGVGKVAVDDATLVCKECKGSGVVRRIGDETSRAFLFQATGFVKKGTGFQLNQNFVDWKGDANESFEVLMKETGKVMDATATTIDAEEAE